MGSSEKKERKRREKGESGLILIFEEGRLLEEMLKNREKLSLSLVY